MSDVYSRDHFRRKLRQSAYTPHAPDAVRALKAVGHSGVLESVRLTSGKSRVGQTLSSQLPHSQPLLRSSHITTAHGALLCPCVGSVCLFF
ncbi:hypothetical protein DPX16_5212 [Anabarilius grahami]|uniref:Uncharacterized protein n=1 Tax=Anabarilius grahami TaxID=495550 RepID=A0A3N0Y2S1_ANAGA|nr:hypothetical protein DPX16_5212 [Anabarilius grahami]